MLSCIRLPPLCVPVHAAWLTDGLPARAGHSCALELALGGGDSFFPLKGVSFCLTGCLHVCSVHCQQGPGAPMLRVTLPARSPGSKASWASHGQQGSGVPSRASRAPQGNYCICNPALCGPPGVFSAWGLALLGPQITADFVTCFDFIQHFNGSAGKVVISAASCVARTP